MPTANYDEPKGQHKRSAAGSWRDELVTIANVRAVHETPDGLNCDFGDHVDHWIAKSQIAEQSEVRHNGDRGRLVITKWLARKSGLMWFVTTQLAWDRLPHTRQLLKELGTTILADHPAQPIVKRITDALRKDLGIAPAQMGGSGDGTHGPNTTN